MCAVLIILIYCNLFLTSGAAADEGAPWHSFAEYKHG